MEHFDTMAMFPMSLDDSPVQHMGQQMQTHMPSLDQHMDSSTFAG